MRQLILIGLFFLKVSVPATAMEARENNESTHSALCRKIPKNWA